MIVWCVVLCLSWGRVFVWVVRCAGVSLVLTGA